MIPKIIHYVWVGGNKKSALIERCIETWKQHVPEYEIRFWNEENIPMEHLYVQEMYRQKKWAFVSDYIRFWALEKEGGIYLDTDMELLKPLDSFLENEVFLGRSKSGHVESSIIGAEPHNSFIQQALNFYDTDILFSIENTSPRVLENILQSGEFSGVQVYGPKYFHPCNEGELCSADVLTKAYARHHWAESWVPFARIRKILRRLGMLSFVKKILKK